MTFKKLKYFIIFATFLPEMKTIGGKSLDRNHLDEFVAAPKCTIIAFSYLMNFLVLFNRDHKMFSYLQWFFFFLFYLLLSNGIILRLNCTCKCLFLKNILQTELFVHDLTCAWPQIIKAHLR